MNIATATDVELLNLKRKSAAIKEELESRGFWDYPARGRRWWTRTNFAAISVGLAPMDKIFGTFDREKHRQDVADANAQLAADKRLAEQCPCFVPSRGGPPA